MFSWVTYMLKHFFQIGISFSKTFTKKWNVRADHNDWVNPNLASFFQIKRRKQQPGGFEHMTFGTAKPCLTTWAITMSNFTLCSGCTSNSSRAHVLKSRVRILPGNLAFFLSSLQWVLEIGLSQTSNTLMPRFAAMDKTSLSCRERVKDQITLGWSCRLWRRRCRASTSWRRWRRWWERRRCRWTARWVASSTEGRILTWLSKFNCVMNCVMMKTTSRSFSLLLHLMRCHEDNWCQMVNSINIVRSKR